ncbi:MAG: L,D-transpeptidase [Patescibacteria group bacterium]|nr:L,D-transpeptidase [Patescibacteria group bacterium]
MHKLLPLAAVILLLGILAFTYLPAKRLIVYKLGISGDPTTSCCEVVNILNSNGNFDEGSNVAIFNNQPIDYPKTSLAALMEDLSNSRVLGTQNAAGEEKWIEVSLDQQKLRAWEGNQIVMEFSISSGRWYPTPTGDFNIWYKTRYQRMKGGSKDLGTYYDLPNVPDNMFFYKGFAIHGAYWHNNFGHPMSHGCVNAPLTQVAQLFEWTGPVIPPGQNAVRATPENPGTRVFIH